jgi:hypothetical protein
MLHTPMGVGQTRKCGGSPPCRRARDEECYPPNHRFEPCPFRAACVCVRGAKQTIFRRQLARRHPRPCTNPANLARSTIHAAAVHPLTSKSKFARHAIVSANLPSVQSCPAVTTLLGISRAPTSVVRIRAQKNLRSRTQGNVASSEKSPFFARLRDCCSAKFSSEIPYRD